MTRPSVAALVLCAAAFAALTIGVALHPEPFGVDRAALAAAEAAQGPGITTVMRAASTVGSTAGITAIVAGVGGSVLALRRDPRPVVWLTITALGSIPMYQILKAVLDRARPPGGLTPATGAAFPSGHATQAVAFFGMLAVVAFGLLRGPARILGVVGALLLGAASGISRIYLEVHWLSDVLGGFLLGGAWLSAVLLLRDRRRRAGE